MSKVALLDGDSWVYRCGFAAEKTYYAVTWAGAELVETFDNHKDAKKRANELGDGVVWSRKEVEPLENCLQMVKSSLENTINVLGASETKLFLSGKRNFRDDLFSDYKANRETNSKPKYYRDIRDYLVSRWGAQIVDGMEADDAIGISAMENPESIIVAVDKDLDQIPGNHYNWTTGQNYTISPRDGMRFFYQQLLSGDPVDNIPGIPGIGAKKAEKALLDCNTPSECAEVVWNLYADGPGRALTADELEKLVDRNARLVWIKRKIDDSHPFWRHRNHVSTA